MKAIKFQTLKFSQVCFWFGREHLDNVGENFVVYFYFGRAI